MVSEGVCSRADKGKYHCDLESAITSKLEMKVRDAAYGYDVMITSHSINGSLSMKLSQNRLALAQPIFRQSALVQEVFSCSRASVRPSYGTLRKKCISVS
jgi:hypothetical protein